MGIHKFVQTQRITAIPFEVIRLRLVDFLYRIERVVFLGRSRTWSNRCDSRRETVVKGYGSCSVKSFG